MGGGKSEIGGGRPGMTTVVPTTDGKWLLTYEYWGGGSNIRYKIVDDPLKFYAAGDDAEIAALPVDPGSHILATGGSPVTIRLPDGRLVYNSNGSGNVWVNESGRSDGTWKEYQTPLGSGYSRNLQYVEGTGRIAILRNQGESTIAYGEVDLGRSQGAYYQLVNRKTGQVIGTGNATVGQRIGQWVDDSEAGSWKLIKADDGYYKFQAVRNANVYLTGDSEGAALTLANAADDGSQDWRLAHTICQHGVTHQPVSQSPMEGGNKSPLVRCDVSPHE